MRDDIVRNTKTSAANATLYVIKFNIYEVHWTIDREKYLQQFLKYSRPLTEQEEISEAEDSKIKQVKPTLDNFRAQVNCIKHFNLFTTNLKKSILLLRFPSFKIYVTRFQQWKNITISTFG